MVFLDGFDHMSFEKGLEEEDGVVTSESEDEDGEEKPVPVEEVKEEALLPVSWPCEACTYINSIDISVCDICTSPRPPMEQIIA